MKELLGLLCAAVVMFMLFTEAYPDLTKGWFKSVTYRRLTLEAYHTKAPIKKWQSHWRSRFTGWGKDINSPVTTWHLRLWRVGVFVVWRE